MENLGQKKKTCEEKDISGKCILKTWRLLIKVKLKSARYSKKYQTKKMWNNAFKCSKFHLYS